MPSHHLLRPPPMRSLVNCSCEWEESRDGKFLNVGCIKIWYNQKIISSHLAIKDCRTLESFEEFASNGCLAMRKRNFAAGNTSSVFSSISFIFILLDYAPRRLHLKTKCTKFFSKVKEWPFIRIPLPSCRWCHVVDWSALFHVNYLSLKSFSLEWSQRLKRHNFPRLGLHLTRFCPLINVVYFLWLLWKMTCSLTQRFVVKTVFH